MTTGGQPRGLACLRTPDRQHGFEPLTTIHGTIPSGLNGALYRVGPGRFENEAGRYAHWFDGEGLVSAIRFQNGAVSAACRMIEPAGSDEPSYARRGRIGSAPRGLIRRLHGLVDRDAFVNLANTALMHWRGRLFALFEAGLPTEIDPETLATLGETDFGVIRRVIGAHPQIHAPTGAFINQGFLPPPRPAIEYYAFESSGDARRLVRVPVSDRFPAHDLAVTDNHVVTLLSPLFMNLPRVIAGAPISRSLSWRPERGTEVVLTPLNGGAPRRLDAPPLFYIHTGNAFEDAGALVIHGVAADDASLADWSGRVRRGAENLEPAPSPGRLTEIRIDMKTGAVSAEPIFRTPMEFPTIDPRWTGKRHSVVYGAGYRDDDRAYGDFSDAIVRFDLAQGRVSKIDFGAGHVVSEPVFVPDGPVEGQGWLLCLNYDTDADLSYVAVARAAEKMDLVARIPLTQALPMSLHGLWLPA
jgi:carotenoid cleavage dioxygenase-like enzyme